MSLLTITALISAFLIAFVVTALTVPPVIRLCERRGWVQRPGGRRTHARPTANVGGIAIYAGFVTALLATFIFSTIDPALRRSEFEVLRIGLLLTGGTLIFLVMWLDDVIELPWLPKLIAQIGAALIAVGPYLWDQRRYPDALGLLTEARGILLTAFNAPFVGQVSLWDVSPWLAILATVFWLGWMANTINWSDGLDGLAAGVSLIAAVMLALHALRLDPPQMTIALLPLALAGACAGFLIFNLPPARIFMGDSGAEFLGFMLGVSAIIGGAKLATVLLVLGVPLLDVAWLIVARTASGKQPMHGGRDHLHYRLLDSGMSPRQVLALYWGLSAGFGLLGIADISPSAKLVGLALLVLIGIGLMAYAARRITVRSSQ
ncbi:MAG: undecaprenyl/decaprenyl-phosphate alpha-N-acetylglucosaminyl 1-phosphate transferase [Roseiflexus sp.]|nr:undecaprenyl/decaprenyl-phosphate alpha-N-acetylglucosaminyl 1-phosphate transferase [Roseiflexus sp.]MCS7289175.1 undecaprenyl/decaprenyl-phosphate alpha-N-acetylglucosaminyl 1-phosphate transferase [Roseiflexus sp.]MDW8232176.1 MraY family glycosyltransferase [Roseiflexaceae bacterium]